MVNFASETKIACLEAASSTSALKLQCRLEQEELHAAMMTSAMETFSASMKCVQLLVLWVKNAIQMTSACLDYLATTVPASAPLCEKVHRLIFIGQRTLPSDPFMRTSDRNGSS